MKRHQVEVADSGLVQAVDRDEMGVAADIRLLADTLTGRKRGNPIFLLLDQHQERFQPDRIDMGAASPYTIIHNKEDMAKK